MAVVSVVLSVLLAAIFAVLGVAKVLRQPSLISRTERLGFSVREIQGIGALEIAGAAGLVAGFFWLPLGIAAAIGLTALLIGAAIAHVRAGDGAKDVVPPVWLALIAAAAAVTGVFAA
ncbi:DoxX family protein [Amycolatopsis thailandensis]|uniref:Invasion protein n=1 Tax=Amycolatopsis thailandensis TaxID=589330 RepID=A0A229SGD7_9PSEU|nr:DoxX family protein [Amycolatopsis thailandensis]OXM57781.1 invasion protein [Amycolatopsis thailandensis]